MKIMCLIFITNYKFFIVIDLLAEHRITNNEDTEKNVHLEQFIIKNNYFSSFISGLGLHQIHGTK